LVIDYPTISLTNHKPMTIESHRIQLQRFAYDARKQLAKAQAEVKRLEEDIVFINDSIAALDLDLPTLMFGTTVKP